MDNQNSILDKVIHSKQTAEIQGFNPSENVSTLLKFLANKEEDVLRRRFGLNGQEKETLESIGQMYQVTRERIRQIESGAIKKIKGLKEFSGISSQMEHVITSVLKRNGSIMEENSLIEQLLRFSSNNEINYNCALFILEELLSTKIKSIHPTLSFKKSWFLPHVSLEFVEQIINKVIEIIKGENKPIVIDQILNKFYAKPALNSDKEKIAQDALKSYIHLSQKIDKNPFDEYGLVEWGTINPKRMRDKIYLVLKKEGTPLHFNKITELINKVKFDNRKAYAPTVHNELILNDDFVLVGRGIYALKEWGYKPGVVADVLVEILKKTKEPLLREELIKRVLEQRIVKKNTIQLALTDKSKFKRLADKRYTLAETLSQDKPQNNT